MKKTRIHFWVPYPLKSAPSQRFRVEQFLPYLNKNDFTIRVCSFLDKETWALYYKKGYFFRKMFGLMKGFSRRLVHLTVAGKADYIFILREAAPIGPPLFEWVLAKILRKKIIYDFDDAIWIPGGEKTIWVKRWMKSTWKIKHIIRWSYKVVAGNDFLSNYAKQFNQSVFVLPSVVDTEKAFNLLRRQDKDEKIVVGWTGSHTTLHNLEEIEHILPELKKEIEFDFLVISNKPPDWNFDFNFKKWEQETELEDLLKMHIGVMPLKRGPWFEGKCGFKLIQYLACGIPAVASPVGINPQIVLHKQTGFIANNREEWKEHLKTLIKDQALRNEMGAKGRAFIESNYSIMLNKPAFINLFS